MATTHHHEASSRTRRVPQRSAAKPPGTMNSAYPSRNALKTRPSCAWDRPNSFMSSAPTTETLTRHR